jgi:hypothetical protein
MSKKISLKRLIEINQPNIICLQETMGVGIEVITLLEKLLKSWNFSRIGFKFLWSGSKEFFFPWVKWESLAIPKALGGWGLKNILLFSKALGEKYILRLISIYILWKHVVTQKYIQPNSDVDWIRNPPKKITTFSVIWKDVINSFAVVGDRLSWRIGNGKQVHISAYPWSGSDDKNILRPDLIEIFYDQGLFHLNQIANLTRTTIWRQEWMEPIQLGLEGDMVIHWTNYIFALKLAHIRNVDMEDELIWKHAPFDIYSPELGYIQQNLARHIQRA